MEKCKKCGSESFYLERKTGQMCAHCIACNLWFTNVPQRQKDTGEAASDEQNSYAYSLLSTHLKGRPRLSKAKAGALISLFKEG